MNNDHSKAHFTDTNQSYWQLAVIQLSGWLSMPVLATSILILQTNSLLGSALTIVVGNAILWFIRFVIIYMTFEKRQSTLDLSREYFGRFGSYFIAALLLVSTFAWFIVQTTAASNTLTHLITIEENPQIDRFIQVSVFLGLVSTLLCIQGIVLLRWISTIAFPILFCAFLMIFYASSHHFPSNNNELSLSGLTLVLATNLGITADMPTFFRHSHSWSDSIKALTIVQVIILILGLASLYFGSFIYDFFEINETYVLNSKDDLLRISLILFVFVSAVLANIANVYSSSVGWEIIAPRALVGRTEYLILGLGLTTAFILLSNIFSPVLLLSISDFALVNLCLVAILGFFLTYYHKSPPSSYQQAVYFIAWLASSTTNAIQLSLDHDHLASTLISSISIIFAVVLSCFLFEALAARARRQ